MSEKKVVDFKAERKTELGDWLRMEDAITGRQGQDVLRGHDLKLDVIGEDSTWEYILAKCEEKGNVCLDLRDSLVYGFWTCPMFWELLRSDAVQHLTLYVDDDDRVGVELIARLTNMYQTLCLKVDLLKRLYEGDATDAMASVGVIKEKGTYRLDMTPVFGPTSILSVADYYTIESSLRKFLQSSGGKKISVDLRNYDLGMICDRVAELAMDDHFQVEVPGVFLAQLLKEMGKIRFRKSGKSYLEYARETLLDSVGESGVLIYEKVSRGYCLPAKLTGFVDDEARFDVVSPINGSFTEYRRFEVSVGLDAVTLDDKLTKRIGSHTFISEQYLSEDVVKGIIHRAFSG